MAICDRRFSSGGKLLLTAFIGSLVSILAIAAPVCRAAIITSGQEIITTTDENSALEQISDSGTLTTILSGLNYPSGVALDAANNLYVSNYGDNEIIQIAPDGLTTQFASVVNAYGLAFDNLGNLYVSQIGTTSTITRVSSTGAVQLFASGFSAPAGLAFGGDGELYVADRDANRIDRVAANGAISLFATGLDEPEGIAFGTDGDLYVACWGTNSIARVTPSGTVTTFANEGFVDPLGVAFDSDGNLFVSNYDAPYISIVAPNGTETSFATGMDTAFIVVVPEPSSLLMMAVSVMPCFRRKLRMRQTISRVARN